MKQVAFDIGFCDQSHLNKLFKRSFGITPNIYKNNNL
jgi:transcriptional regulator GlxA family with amidase domain